MKHFLIAGHGYIGQVHQSVAPIPAEYLVRHLPEQAEGIFHLDFDNAVESKPLFFDICTPNISHKELALQAAKAGLPIYCEKPLSNDLESALEMKKAVEQTGLMTGMAFNYRFLPCVHLLKEILHDGVLGKIIYYKASFFHDSYLLPRTKAWRTTAGAGGGALADLGIHIFDLCRYIFGESQLKSCEKHIEFPERTEVDEYARCTLESEQGKGYLEISRITAGRARENGIEVYGHNGSARIYFDRPYDIEFYDIRTKETRIITAPSDLMSRLNYPDQKHDMGMFYGSHRAAIHTFIQCLEQGKKSEVLASFEDGVAAQRLLSAAIEA